MRDSWYLRQAGVESGPVSFDTITEWAHAGRIQPDDELRRSDQQSWQSASEFAGLFDAPAAGDAGDDDMFGDILSAAAADDGTHATGQRVGQLLEDQLGYDPHHPRTPAKVPRYYCRVQGKESVPFTIEELQQRADDGLFSPFDRVRREDGKAWVPAQELSEIRFGTTASAAFKSRSVSPVADVVARENTTPPAAAPVSKPSVESLIDDVLSTSESERPRPAATPSPHKTASRPQSPATNTQRERPAAPSAAGSSTPRSLVDEPKRSPAPGVSAPSAPSAPPVKSSSPRPRRARSISLPSISLPRISLPKMEFKMPSGTLIAALVGVLLLAVVVWWWMSPDPPSVMGEVTVDQEPVPKGSISFQPIQGTRGSPLTVPIVQGKFEAGVSDLLGSGPHRVSVLIGNSMGPPPQEFATLPTFKSLNGAVFETEIDTSSGDEKLFVFEFKAADATIRAEASGSVVTPGTN